MNAHHVFQSHVQQGLAELRVVAVSSVGDDGRTRNAIDDGSLDLFGGDGQAGRYRTDGEANGDLAVALFTDLAAVLPGGADEALKMSITASCRRTSRKGAG